MRFITKDRHLKTLVTGGAGFIGSAVVRQAVAAGHKIVNLDALTYAACLENLNEVVSINTNVNLDKKPVKLYEKANTTVESLSGFLQNSNAEIHNLICPDQTVKVVPAYLDSILMNFITNAVKYRDPSRVPVITLSTEKTNNYTVLNISDNGLGIDLKRYGEKLFGMYKTFHANDEARGIGLYITKNQVEAMGGFITTSSEVGKGTTFKIHFNDKD